MTDIAQMPSAATLVARRQRSPDEIQARIRRRYAAERRLRAIGLAGVVTALGLLALLLVTIVAQGHSAFVQTMIRLDIAFDEAVIDPDGARDPRTLAAANYAKLVQNALSESFPGSRAGARSGRCAG